MTEQSFFPPLLDVSTADLQTCKQHLLGEITRVPERRHLSDLARRRTPRRQRVLAIGLVAAASCSVIGVVVFGNHTSPSAGQGLGAPLGLGLGGVGLGPTGQSSPKTIALSDASTTLGSAVVLPDTAVVRPSDASSEARALDCPSDDARYPCVVGVSFPTQSIWIQYVRPFPAEDAWRYLHGDPGVWFDNPSWSGVAFVTGGTVIEVFTRPGSYGEADVQAIAQSILDRSK